MAMPSMMMIIATQNQRTYGGGYGFGPPGLGDDWAFYLLCAAIILIPILSVIAVILLA